MNCTGIYESGGSIIYGLEGYADVVWDIDRIGAILFFNLKENRKYIIGSRILVSMGGIGRKKRIVAIHEVSRVDNLSNTISGFVDAVKPQIEGLGYTIVDEDFNKIEGSFSAESSKEMRATLVLNLLRGDPTWIRSSEPVKVLSLISDVYSELDPILHLIDLGFLISVMKDSTSVWISSQIDYPTIDFDSNYECPKNVSKLYKAYHALKKRGKLDGMKSREQVMKLLQLEAGILTIESLGTVLATRYREKLETFAEKKDRPNLLNLLADIESVNDVGFNWAINILGEVIKSLDGEITEEVAVKLLNKISTDQVYGYKVDFYKLLYDQINTNENIQTDFLEKNIDKIKNKSLQLKLINDYLGIHPEESDRFKKLIYSYSQNDIDGYSNIKTAAEKWNKHNSPPKEIDVDPTLGIPSGKGDNIFRSPILLATSAILLIIAVYIAVFGIPSIAPPTTPQILITTNPSNISVGELTDLKISVMANDALLDNVTITLSGAVTSTNLTNSTGVAIIGVNATNGDSITVTANKSGYANGTGRIHVITADATNDDNVTVTPNISGIEDQKDNVSVQSWVESIKGLISQGIEYVF